jgi:hypothetical protein
MKSLNDHRIDIEVQFDMHLTLRDLVYAECWDGLNSLADDWCPNTQGLDESGTDYVLSEISYVPVSVNQDGTITIKVHALLT